MLLLVIGLFCFLRFYNLPNSLYFWGDIGRDHEVLIEMLQKQRPTLLGPSNSVIPFNQSAWYFYLNIPVFVISKASPFTTAITGVILNMLAMLCVFIIGIEKRKKERLIQISTTTATLLSAFFLYSFNPLLLEQQRSTWNPAFALPFLLIAFAVLWELISKKDTSKKIILLLSLCLVFAVGMTYAVLPLVFILIGVIFWLLPPSRRVFFIACLTASGIFVFLPHLLFEMKYNFILTKQLINSSSGGVSQLLQQKITTGFFYIFGYKKISYEYVLPILSSIVFLVIGIWRSSDDVRRKLLLFLGILLSSFLISVLLIKEFHSHYGIAFSLMLLFMVAHLPKKWLFIISTILIISWWPLAHAQIFLKPHRTVGDLDACAQLVCERYPQPMFVTAQAWHEFHSGFDYSFFFNRNGCYTRDIATNPNFAETLAVVVDASNFDEKTTAFHELTLFGPKQLESSISCNSQLTVYYFSKRK